MFADWSYAVNITHSLSNTDLNGPSQEAIRIVCVVSIICRTDFSEVKDPDVVLEAGPARRAWMATATVATESTSQGEGGEGLVDISVSLVSGKSVVLQMPWDSKASAVKQNAAEQLGFGGEEVELVLGGHPVRDELNALDLSKALVKLVVLSSGQIAFANKFRIAVVSGSTLKECLALDLGQTKRRSPYMVSWNPANITMLAVRARNLAWIYDISTGQEPWSRKFQQVAGKFVRANRKLAGCVETSDFQWTADGRKLIFVNCREVIICDIASGTEQILTQESDVSGLSLHPDGALLAVARIDGISLFDLVQGREKDNWLLPQPATHLKWDPSGRFLASAEINGSLRILSLEGELKWILRQSDAAHQMGMQDTLAGLAWSPCESLLAFSSSMGSSFQVFNAEKGKIAWKSSGLGPFADFAWNYNGLKLAAASPRGTIHVFSVQGLVIGLCLGPVLEALVGFRLLIYQAVIRRLVAGIPTAAQRPLFRVLYPFMEQRVSELEDIVQELQAEIRLLRSELRRLRRAVREGGERHSLSEDRDSTGSGRSHRDSRRGSGAESDGSFSLVREREFNEAASRSRSGTSSPAPTTPSEHSASLPWSDTRSVASSGCGLTWLQREAICDGIAEHIKRCLRGDHRGESGRDRIHLPSRIWLVFKDYEGTVYNPVKVCRSFGACKELVKRGEHCGDSIFVGLPSEREACRVAGQSGVGWPIGR
eukprot:s81_g21.t2